MQHAVAMYTLHHKTEQTPKILRSSVNFR